MLQHTSCSQGTQCVGRSFECFTIMVKRFFNRRMVLADCYPRCIRYGIRLARRSGSFLEPLLVNRVQSSVTHVLKNISEITSKIFFTIASKISSHLSCGYLKDIFHRLHRDNRIRVHTSTEFNTFLLSIRLICEPTRAHSKL